MDDVNDEAVCRRLQWQRSGAHQQCHNVKQHW